MSNRKSPGIDGRPTPAEVFQLCTTGLLPHLVDLTELIWKEATVPQDFKDAVIVHTYKRKEDRSRCDTHRGIWLLSVVRSGVSHTCVFLLRLKCVFLSA